MNDNSDLAVEGVEHIAISDNAGHNYTAMTYLCCGRTTNVQSTLLLGECKLVKQNSTYTVFKSDADSFSDTMQHSNTIMVLFVQLTTYPVFLLLPQPAHFQGLLSYIRKFH